MKQSQNHLFMAGTAEGKLTCNDSRTGDVVKEFEDFDKLTSVHISCDNTSLLISGYRKDAHIYDIETGKVVREYVGIHTDHINISRFANHSPSIFSTSSFDSTVKTWDTRMTETKPIYTLKANSGIVMINFSSDDNFILASALDNEIKQYLFVDGRLHLQYDIPSTGLKGNFTRAYYSASGKYTITGACEERNVKFLCSYTGEYLSSVDMYPSRRDKSLYIQSLRGSPCSDNEVCVLANYRDNIHRELIVARGHVRRPDEVPGYARDESQVGASHFVNDADENRSEIVGDNLHIAEYLPFSSSKLCEELFKLRVNTLKEGVVNDEVISLIHHGVGEDERLLGKYRIFHSKEETGSFHSDMQALIQLCYGDNFHRIHGFIVLSRCPLLYEFYRQQQNETSAELRSYIDLTTLVPSHLWYIISLLVDYLYLGFNALESSSLKGYALAKYFVGKDRQIWESEKNSIMKQIPGISTSAVDELTLMCVDESIWRMNSFLAFSLCDVVMGLFDLAVMFSIRNLITKCCDLLGDLLQPMNVVKIALWAVRNGQESLYEKCLVFALKASHVVLLPDPVLNSIPLIDACRGFSTPKSEPPEKNNEISPEMTRLIVDINSKLATHTPMVVTRADIQKGRSHRMISATVLYEDSPFLADAANQITHAVIPKQYNHASCMLRDRYIVYFGGISADRWLHLSKLLAYDTKECMFFYLDCHGTRVPTMSNYSSALPLTKHNSSKCVFMSGKIRRGERAESKASTKTNFIWHSLNKHKINGLNPKAVVKSIARYEEEEDEAEQHDENIDPNRVFLHEFDFDFATWNLVKVKIEDGLNEQGRASMRYRRNRVLDSEQHNERVSATERRLVMALNRRLGGANVPLYLEDIPYQCAKCLFVNCAQQDANEVSSCNCFFSTVANMPSDECSYMLQFGGYCAKEEEFKNDLHVLVCKRDQNDELLDHCVRYQYTWKKVNTIGESPSPRYSHAATMVPANGASAANNVARMFVHGGASFEGHVQDLACLQIKSMRSGTGRVDAQWIPIRVVGPQPQRRYKHTLNYVPSSNICVLFGGCGARGTGAEIYDNDLWSFSWSYNNSLELECLWTLISHDNAFAPEPRSYHTCNVLSSTASSGDRIFIFGGMNETIGSPVGRDERSEERIKESVMHSCNISSSRDENGGDIVSAQWVDSSQRSGRILLIEREASQSLSFCSLGADLKNLIFSKEYGGNFIGNNPDLQWQREIAHLLNETRNDSELPINPFLPNVKILVPFASDVSNVEEFCYNAVASFGSLVTSRCAVFEAMLSSSMLEAKTREIKLSAHTNYELFKRMMVFICSNYIGSLDLQEMVEFLGLANEYGVTALVKKCEGALLRMISFSTVCEILSYAEWLGLDLLRAACYSQLFRSNNILDLISMSACEDANPEELSTAIEEEADDNERVVSLIAYKQLPQEARVRFVEYARSKTHIAVVSIGVGC